MEAKIATLEVRVDALEKRADEHEDEDRRLHKYMTNMLEDVKGQLATLERTGARFEADLMHRNGSDTRISDSMKEIFERLRTVERLIWIAVGGMVVIGGIVSIIGNHILRLLAK